MRHYRDFKLVDKLLVKTQRSDDPQAKYGSLET